MYQDLEQSASINGKSTTGSTSNVHEPYQRLVDPEILIELVSSVKIYIHQKTAENPHVNKRPRSMVKQNDVVICCPGNPLMPQLTISRLGQGPLGHAHTGEPNS